MATTALYRKGMILMLLLSLLLGSYQPAGAFLQTLGDLLSLGANTVREIQEAILLAGSEVSTILNGIDGTIRDLMDELEDKFQNNLNITIDSLDNATRNKFLELQSLLLSVNDVLKDDVRFLSEQAKQLLRDASVQVQRLSAELKADLADVAIIGGETGAFLIERATENIVIIGSIILLAIGILLFVFLFLRQNKPSGALAVLGVILALGYVALFGALILVPSFRTFIMSSTGIGLRDRLNTVTLQPNMIAVVPDTITVGETTALDIWGSSLLPNGEQPIITISDKTIPFTAANDRIVLDLSDIRAAAADSTAAAVPEFNLNPDFTRDLLTQPLAPINPVTPPTGSIPPLVDQDFVLINRDLADQLGIDLLIPIDVIVGDLVPVDPTVLGSIPLPEGAALLKLDYANFTDLTSIVTVFVPPPPLSPPDLSVTSFTLTPSSANTGDNVAASITIRNNGEQPANNFILSWKPTPTTVARTTTVSSLAAGASQTFSFNFAYPNAGTFTSVVEVDTLNSVAESNEGNNSRTRSITIATPPPRTATVTVTFHSALIEDDADPAASGEVRLTFNVNGQIQRVPTSGERDVNSGSTITFTRTFTLTLTEGQNLVINVSGIETDWPDSDDSMGNFTAVFTSGQNWGAGARSNRSSCPDGCFTVFYDIEVSG
ncbi:MAG TPA: CARDB domain-containing protein [Aggregatilineales bacterium]|nr:CARDB domain-containing protein [Aggregatilineales bacterium]